MSTTPSSAATPKRKIAILGGGCGGLSAAWGLVNSPQAAELEITVYQMGWRLGGKGASGRNAKVAERIEEHGLHIWGGMYENAFAMMRAVYGELGRPRGTPLSTWYDPARPADSAFLPHSRTTLTEFYDGRWAPWTLELPADEALPGDGRMLPTLTEYLHLLVDALEEALFGRHVHWHTDDASVVHKAATFAARGALRLAAHGHLQRVRRSVAALPADATTHRAEHHAPVHTALNDLEHWVGSVLGRWLEHHAGFRHIYMIANLGASVLRGVLTDGILRDGLDVVDGVEFREWLRRHGASALTLDGVLVRGWHAFFFAYVDGDITRPSLSAASGLRTLFRYAFTYRGAFFWKMQAGMGDTIFAPLYQALQRRGVEFKFFHRVEALELGAPGAAADQVEVIRLTRQVDLANGVRAYDPLKTVRDVPSWPSTPRYEQIDPAQAAQLTAQGIDLESWWTPWPGVGTVTLERGRDFDDVILAIPPAATRFLTPQLAARSVRWREMLERLASNQTVAAQIWSRRSLEEMGWSKGSTVGTVYANPLNTWANMDQLLVRETWGDGADAPRSVVYFCGTIADAVPTPAFSDHGFPAEQDARIRDVAITWLDTNLGPLYPGACLPGTPQFDWSTLRPRTSTPGEHGFDTQYWRINIEPSERYVLSLPGTGRFRPRAHESGFANLYLAGDWLRTGINAGCVEAAVMGGLQASKAMTGYPAVIVGDDL